MGMKATGGKPDLTLTGPTAGGPTLADLLALARQLTGRDPTATEIAQAKMILDKTIPASTNSSKP